MGDAGLGESLNLSPRRRPGPASPRPSLRESGTPPHPLGRHPGQAKRDPGPIRSQSGGETRPRKPRPKDVIPVSAKPKTGIQYTRTIEVGPQPCRRTAGGGQLCATICPGGYWIPAFAGMTAGGGVGASRLTPAEGTPGSRLSGFACGRDDLRERGTTSHPLGRHPGQAKRDPGPIGFQSGGETHRPCHTRPSPPLRGRCRRKPTEGGEQQGGNSGCGDTAARAYTPNVIPIPAKPETGNQ